MIFELLQTRAAKRGSPACKQRGCWYVHLWPVPQHLGQRFLGPGVLKCLLAAVCEVPARKQAYKRRIWPGGAQEDAQGSVKILCPCPVMSCPQNGGSVPTSVLHLLDYTWTFTRLLSPPDKTVSATAQNRY